jgi:molybdopterin-containing oxidoreductase family membrane subunit
MASTTIEQPKPFSWKPSNIIWYLFLGLLLMIGLVSAGIVFWNGLVVTNMSDQVPWGLWITIDLSAIALGAGAFTLSAVVYLFKIKSFRSIVRLAILVGFIGYTSALLSLVMDIGRPDRFWHPWVFWNVHSVLWEITWCITIYLTIMLLEFLPVIVEGPFFDRWPWTRKVADLLHRAAPAFALAGLLISLLHQSSLGATYGVIKSRPIWFKPSMPIMFILSAIAVGPALTMAVVYVLEWIKGKKLVPDQVKWNIARFSGFALMAYGYIKIWDIAAVTYYGRTPAVSNALNLLNTQTPYNFGFWFGEIILGIVVPVVIFLNPRTNKKPVYLVIGAFSAVLGLIFNRWDTTVSGLSVPVQYSPGITSAIEPVKYFPALIEWGVVLGILGYALLLLTLGVRYLPLFDSKNH